MTSADDGKRGPKTKLDDDALVEAIRAVLAACPFHSEGHRKVHARLRAGDIRVGRKRVLRLMRAQHLLAPSRPRHEHGDPAHAGTIVTTRPDEMWGTDATRFYTEREGWCWFFGVLDTAQRGAARFPHAVRRVFLTALALRDRRDAGTLAGHGLAVSLGRLDARTTRLLAGRLTRPHLRILLESGAGVRRLDVALAHSARGAAHALPVGHLPRVGYVVFSWTWAGQNLSNQPRLLRVLTRFNEGSLAKCRRHGH